MQPLAPLILALLLAPGLMACGAPGTAHLPTVAVLRVETFGMSDARGRKLRQTIARAVRPNAAAVLKSAKVDGALERGGRCQQLDPEQRDGCALRAGRRLGASHVVASSVGKLGKTHLLRLRMLKVAGGATTRTLEEMVLGDFSAIKARLEALAGQLIDAPRRPPAWYRRWWVWTAAGVVVAGAAAAAVVATWPQQDEGISLP